MVEINHLSNVICSSACCARSYFVNHAHRRVAPAHILKFLLIDVSRSLIFCDSCSSACCARSYFVICAHRRVAPAHNLKIMLIDVSRSLILCESCSSTCRARSSLKRELNQLWFSSLEVGVTNLVIFKYY